MQRLLTVGLLLLATNLSAQTVVGDRFRLNTGPCVLRSGSGTPESSVTGNICDMYVDTVNGTWYTKWTGTNTNTGWRVGHNANAIMSGNVGTSNYVSQLTGWRIDNLGAGDFRYLFTDELHAKSFIADLEQALAGGQIICKSVTSLGANFTNPATGATATLTVRDLPSAPNVSTFQANDWVGIRTFSRTAGSLTIAETFGVVTAYADQANGVQTWTFTRGTGANGGGLAAATVIEIDAIVIDYGVSGNGCHEINAIDGANGINSPYNQTWEWTTSPIVANRSLRTRVGNLRGITGNTEFGAILGSYTTGTGTDTYVLAGDVSGVKINNVDLRVYSSTTEVFRVNPAVPSMAFGSSTPTGYSTGIGMWMGFDAGAFKWRIGNPAANRVTWDGTSMTFVGAGGGITNINGANIQTGTITADKITTATLSAISANIGTITAGSISGVTINGGGVLLDANGITLPNGQGSINQVKWTDGAFVWNSSGTWLQSAPTRMYFRIGGAAGPGFRIEARQLIPENLPGTLGTPGSRWGLFTNSLDIQGNVVVDGGVGTMNAVIDVDDSACGSARRFFDVRRGMIVNSGCR